MENYLKNKHIISRCNSLLKAMTINALEWYTGDNISVAYWRLRNGKGLLTYNDKKSLDIWNSQITKVRRFFTSPLPLTEEDHDKLTAKREEVIQQMEDYRDWLEFGSNPVYLTSRSAHPEYAAYSLEMALNILLEDKGLTSDVLYGSKGKEAGDRLRMVAESIDANRLLSYDGLISSQIYKQVQSGVEVHKVIKNLQEEGKSLLPLDQTWHIRADNDNRSSVGANINGLLEWLYYVDDKSTDHQEFYIRNSYTIDAFIAWKKQEKELYALAKKTNKKAKPDSSSMLDEFLKRLFDLKVPDFIPIIRNDL